MTRLGSQWPCHAARGPNTILSWAWSGLTTVAAPPSIGRQGDGHYLAGGGLATTVPFFHSLEASAAGMTGFYLKGKKFVSEEKNKQTNGQVQTVISSKITSEKLPVGRRWRKPPLPRLGL